MWEVAVHRLRIDAAEEGALAEKWCVKKASPGLDPTGDIARLLGPDFIVKEYVASVPLVRQVEDAHVLLVRAVPVTKEVIDAASRLRLIQRSGAHLDRVDVAYAGSRDILVCNVLLAVAKRYRESFGALMKGYMGEPPTYTLRGKVLGLVGVGQIGTALIPMARVAPRC